MKKLLAAALPTLFLLAAGCGDSTAAGGNTAPVGTPGLSVKPRWITFGCTTPGCDATETIRLTVTGDRRLAIKRIVLADDERTDFVLTSDQRPPFIVGVEEAFSVTVQHVPTATSPREGTDLIVTFGDASDSETGRIEPQDVLVPLIRRVVGEATVRVEPERLVFGSVRPGAESTLPLQLFNEGSGNVPLAVAEVLSDVEEVGVAELPQEAALPGTSMELPVTFEPTREAYVEGKLLIRTTDPGLALVEVPVAGTSIVAATMSFVPVDGIDFGSIPRHAVGEATLTLVNQGGTAAQITRLETSGSYPGLTLISDAGEPPFAVPPLGTVDIHLTLLAETPGELAENISITSTGSFFPLDVPVIGLVTEPDVAVNPLAVDFGTVPRGWISRQTVEIENAGYGELEVQRLDMVLGSSALFRLAEIPTLPARLQRGERLPVHLEFRAEGEATFSGSLAVETSDPDMPFLEVPLTATGATCDNACVIPHAIPTCADGGCSIESCVAGRYDSDGDVTNGCECLDPNNDPGGFCSDGEYKGSLSDGSGDRASHTGILPTAEDVDFIRFHGKDDSQLWGDDFDVRISLSSSDPSIRMCVYRHDTAEHGGECILENESCGTSYSRGGSLGSEDGADFAIKIFRDPGAAPSCASYTVNMSNG